MGLREAKGGRDAVSFSVERVKSSVVRQSTHSEGQGTNLSLRRVAYDSCFGRGSESVALGVKVDESFWRKLKMSFEMGEKGPVKETSQLQRN